MRGEVKQAIPPARGSTGWASRSPSPRPRLVGLALTQLVSQGSCSPSVLGSTLDRAEHRGRLGATPTRHLSAGDSPVGLCLCCPQQICGAGAASPCAEDLVLPKTVSPRA